jgi:hypothetical protein
MPDGTVKNFSKAVCSSLGHYVYCLADPRNKEIFYVGKGQNNRVFDQQYQPEQEAEDEADERAKRVKDIEADGQEVQRYILCHGLDEEEQAFVVETCVISLLQAGLLKNVELLNQARGHHYPTWGIASVNDIAAKYSLPVQSECFRDPVMVVNVSRTRAAAETLYDAARGNWRASEERLKNSLGRHYVIAEYDGVLVDVFKPAAWMKLPDGKMCFENTKGFGKGNAEYKELFDRYCNRLSGFHQPGEQNLVHYFNM